MFWPGEFHGLYSPWGRKELYLTERLSLSLLGKIEGKKRRRRQRMRWLDVITDSVDMHWSKPQEIMEDRGAWHAAVLGLVKDQTWLSDWTRLNNNSGRGTGSPLYSYYRRLRPICLSAEGALLENTVSGGRKIKRKEIWGMLLINQPCSEFMTW